MLIERVVLKHLKMQVIVPLALLLLFASVLSACGSSAQLPIQALSGYQFSLFASGNTSYQNPDGVAVDQGHVFIDYQNFAEKDGSDHKTSTVVEYNMSGQVLGMFSVSGHSDGLRVDPATHLLWALSNEIKNPLLTIIDPDTKKPSLVYKIPAEHGGGYDDLYFLKGLPYPFISASNPTLDKNGANDNPAVYEITKLENGYPGLVDVAPVLVGNASAIDVVTKATVTLDERDTDSLSVDTRGNLVLVNEVGGDIVFLGDPGTLLQKVRRLRVGTQIDDTVWIPSVRGRLLIVDSARNQTYWMDAAFTPGTVYTETGPDSTVQSVVGQLDPDTGIITIVATGFLKPTGLVFVPD